MPLFILFGALLILAIGTVGSAYVLARRAGPIVPLAFIAVYVLAMGAITFIDSISRLEGDVGDIGWLTFEWPFFTVLFTPSAISALLACWFSRPLTPRDSVALLSVYLCLILVALEWAVRPDEGFWFLVGELAILSTTFFAMALWRRIAGASNTNLDREEVDK